jgi:glycosyltransferase involved in cell wall biosynthesis
MPGEIDHVSISIVTATLNRRDYLEKAIRNVMDQGIAAFEHIIVDGQSDDGTLEMLKNFPHLQIISENDQNLYDAWNKGISRARGNLICILNSDDELPDGALEEVIKLMQRHPDVDLISGPVELERRGDNGQLTRHRIDDPHMLSLREQDIGPGVPLTNGRFIARRFFDQIGLFDIQYPAISDRQFFLRAILAKAKNIVTDVPLYRYRVHEGSLTLNDRKPSLELAEECHLAAYRGLLNAKSKEEAAAYRRWFAWTIFYQAYLKFRAGSIAQAFRSAGQGVLVDPGWFIRLLPMAWRHLREKELRQGRLLP